jgi:two-component system cell cycle response regulator
MNDQQDDNDQTTTEIRGATPTGGTPDSSPSMDVPQSSEAAAAGTGSEWDRLPGPHLLVGTDLLGDRPRPISDACRDACLVHIYPSGPSMGRRYPLSPTAGAMIGRGADCPIHIDDSSVSRKHARIEPTPQGYCAIDQGSTNGTFINDQPIVRRLLSDGDYLRVGNCIYRFLAGGNIEAEYHEEIYRLAIIDGLTDVPNKRYLLEFLTRELSRSARHQHPLALLLFDIDRFKSVNDNHGHLCGDHVLRELAALLRGVVRPEELLARYGGEEFAIVLPDCLHDNALVVGERSRGLVEQHPFKFDEKAIPVTISVGVACVSGEVLSPLERTRNYTKQNAPGGTVSWGDREDYLPPRVCRPFVAPRGQAASPPGPAP